MTSSRTPKVPAWVVGELIGTFLLVFFGCGSVATAVLTSAQVGIFQVAIVWGIGITTAIYLTASLSGAHLNPAVTVAFAVWADFPWKKVPGYILAQFAGAFIARHRVVCLVSRCPGRLRIGSSYRAGRFWKRSDCDDLRRVFSQSGRSASVRVGPGHRVHANGLLDRDARHRNSHARYLWLRETSATPRVLRSSRLRPSALR